ncbi:ArsR/SmtB family transcription factor [Paenibacillus senegalensis]|uniref:ArsR/SmtB family transcription factor n=1 Tax=Paenibacillus senegalensis TaxID=1465766 RepID=UPI0002881E6A|nr:helix-turn-helix domain-containing protein [Paenibacillus senegalensis]
MSEFGKNLLTIPSSRIIEVAKALSGDVRLRILEALGDQSMSIGQLAETLGVAQPTISINVQILEQAGLLSSSLNANREKICSVTGRNLLLELPSRLGEGLQQIESLHMPIGLYSHCSVQPTCGMADREGRIIGSPDDPRAFYLSERTEAAILWFSGAGYLEYLFSNPLPPGVELEELRVTAELCSEAPGFNQQWPSDISLFINDKPVGTWTSPADFGDRKGRLTTSRWSGSEYGQLTEWVVTRHGSRVNGSPADATAIPDLELAYHRPIRIRLEVCRDSRNQRGLNLFGAGFGDYPQDLVLSFVKRNPG